MKGICGECERRYFCEIDPDKCDEWADPPPQTNADRIRAMSDEELANFLTIFVNDEGEDFFCDNPKRRVVCRECKQCIVEWLKQPAEEDTE